MIKSKTKLKKQLKSKSEDQLTESVQSELHEEDKEDKEEVVKEKDIRTVTITVDSYQNIVPLMPTADVSAKCKYQDKIIGETSAIPITDDPNLVINQSFSFKVNLKARKDTDSLISSPALLTILQVAGTYDRNLYEQLQKSDNIKQAGSSKSFDSILSIYEAFTGETVDREVLEGEQKKFKPKPKKEKEEKKKEKKKEKGSKSSKASKASKATVAAGKKQRGRKDVISTTGSDSESKPIVYGMCAIDFLPLFYGKSSYTECLIINPTETFFDERMITYKILPKVTVTVSIDLEICFFRPVILNFTVESIYNLPSVMKSEMEYKICTVLPMEDSPGEPIIFTSPVYDTKNQKNLMKCWYGIKKLSVENTTRYRVSEDNIKNTTELSNIEECINGIGPRLRFNVLKRNLLLREGMAALTHQIKKYKKILIEIYMCPKEKSVRSSESRAIVGVEQFSDPSLRSINRQESKGAVTRKKSPIFLHLMALVDVTALLHPGVTKIRVATPLTTFSHDEAVLYTGLVESYFAPKQGEPVDFIEEDEEIEYKVEKKSEKSKKDKKDKSSKSSKVSKKAPKVESTNLKYNLPPRPETPPPPEPSNPVYNEAGKQCFIVTEIELSKPIYKKKDVEDLSNELQDLLQEKMEHSSKIVLTHRLTKDYYREVLNRITKDIYDKYKHYLLTKEQVTTLAEKDFIKYLESVGAYQSYLTSIKEAISLLTATKFHFDEADRKNNLIYQNFIGEVFVYLVSEMNDTLNRLVCSGLEPVLTPEPKPSDTLLFYAKEAAALGKTDLADRYFLERICYEDTKNPNSWFDYAVFNLEIKQFDKAYECVVEALAKKSTHRYSLLLMGAMLADRGQKDEAETCFLNLLVHESRWVEGWVVLYLFYQKFDKYEGMDMAMEMVKKYLDDKRFTSDYFMMNEDLLWTSKICPKTMFFRAAVLLLKMRLYDWVERALVQEVQENVGIVNYLLSAVCLYQGMHEQALEHIHHTKAYSGPNYAVSGLSGHCLFALNIYSEAKEEYYHVLHSPDKPNDIHMVYINCAQILENSGNHQEARKLILLACKYSPTHYTWFKAGQLYLKENDLLSSEECFSEANFKDNRCPEYWGYLTLINLKLNRLNEAELCYSQAIKNKLDQKMCDTIKAEFKKVGSSAV